MTVEKKCKKCISIDTVFTTISHVTMIRSMTTDIESQRKNDMLHD